MNTSRGLVNKIALVSGSSRGIGKGIARSLLSQGACVYITGRSQNELKKTFDEFQEEFPDNVCKFQGDLNSPGTIAELMKKVQTDRGHLDICVANIGSGKSQSGWDIADNFWEQSLQVNFFSAVRLSREAIRLMIPAGKGAIIFIASIAGIESIAAPVPYSCAKAALLAYMKNTAPLAARSGIRMNAVSPGNIQFPGGTWEKKMQENPSATQEYIHENVPLQRFGTPADIGSMVCYLASDEAAFITGANFIVDGGQTRSV